MCLAEFFAVSASMPREQAAGIARSRLTTADVSAAGIAPTPTPDLADGNSSYEFDRMFQPFTLGSLLADRRNCQRLLATIFLWKADTGDETLYDHLVRRAALIQSRRDALADRHLLALIQSHGDAAADRHCLS